MLRLFILFLCLSMFSCYKADVVQYQTWNQDPLTKESGYQVNRLQRQYNVFDGGRFLYKYDDTMWTDTENYYSDFSDIKFKNKVQLDILHHSLILIKMFRIVTDGKKVKTLMMEKNGI